MTDSSTASDKRRAFTALHQRGSPFVIPNPWDVGTAKFLSRMGFEALATTSAGYAFSVGKSDNHIGREEMFHHIEQLANATSLPMSADLENGYGDEPATVAETIKMALQARLAGASIEDARGKPDSSIYSIELAVERIQAAVEAADSANTHFVLTARAENYLCGNPDIHDTIKRLQAYQEAGADVLYAPGLKTAEDIRAVTSSVDKPVNVVMGLAGTDFTISQLGALNVTRISVGSALTRLMFGALQEASQEMLQQGSFGFADRAMPFGDIDARMQDDD